MGELGNEILKSTRSRIGEPFRHHFKPINLCEGGTVTVNECMERGMDCRGYDCSGLVIASLCEVLGITTSEWPRQLRHTQQFKSLATGDTSQPGDLRLYYSANDRVHIGVATETVNVVHASGRSNQVEEGFVTSDTDPFVAVRTVAAHSLLKAIHQNN